MKDRKMPVDYGLYLVTDRVPASGLSIEQIVAESIRGGVTVVQLREKNLSTREFVRQALALKSAVSGMGIPFIINDRVDIALACEAAGVHLGQDDMNCALARRIVGKDVLIGVSVSTAEEARQAEAEGADYLGVGPVFQTTTKTDASQPTGLAVLSEIRRIVRIPFVGIGGITPANAADVIRSGADGVAVVSAIVASLDPHHAARDIRSAVDEARAKTAPNPQDFCR